MLKTTSVKKLSPTNVRRSIRVDNSRVSNADKVKEMGYNLSKGKNLSKINPSRVNFLTPEASIAFTCLRKAFSKAPILYYFDSECYIRIGTNASSFASSVIFSELILRYVTYTNPDLSIFKIG